MIELYQLYPDGTIVSLGGSAQAEGEASEFVERYPKAGYHIFFGTRVIEPCDPPVIDEDDFQIPESWGLHSG